MWHWRRGIPARDSAELGSGQTTVLERLGEVAARDDLASRLAEAYDGELLELAMERVRLRVEPRTWEAFRLSGIEVASRVGIEVATAYKARSKVQKMLREEVRLLGEDPGP